MRVHAVFDESFGVLEELSSKNGDGGCSISNLIVLTFCDVDEDLGGCVFDIKKLEDGCAVVRDGCIFMGGDHFIHSSRTWVRGEIPRVDLTISTMASTALMLEMTCPIPYMESVPSRRRRIVGCYDKGSVYQKMAHLNIFKKI